MKEKNKIQIISVYNELCVRDPSWRGRQMLAKFKILYGGWADTCVRHNKHSREYFSRKWKDGWLPLGEYMNFYKYAMQ